MELKQDYSIVIVTHNMQQAARVSDKTAFFTVELDDEEHRTGVSSSSTTPRRSSPTRPTRAPRRTSPARSGRGDVPDTRSHQFQEELAKLEEQALGGLDMVVDALDRALETVQQQDVELASMVIADDDRIDGAISRCTRACSRCWRCQAPVAGDLRLVAALLHIEKNIERMGDQCVNMAKLVPLAGHEPPSDEDPGRHPAMGEQARRRSCSASRRSSGATSIWRRTWCARTTRSTGSTARCSTSRSRSATTRHARVGRAHDAGRSLHRAIGDNAVDIGEQTVFVVTGLFRSSRTPRTRSSLRRPPLDLRLHRHRQQHNAAAGGGCRRRTAARARHPAGVRASARSLDRLDPGGQDRRDRRGGGDPGGGRARGRRRADRGGGHRRDPQRAQPRRAAERGQEAGGMELEVLSGEEEARCRSWAPRARCCAADGPSR